MNQDADQNDHVLRLPVAALPTIRLVGRYAHLDQHFTTRYRATFLALHWYEYPCRMRLDDLEFALEPGMFSITPAGVTSRYHLPRPGHHWCVHFRLPQPKADDTAELPLWGEAPAGPLPMEQRYAQITLLHSDPRPSAQHRARLLLQDLLLSLDESTPSRGSDQPRGTPEPGHKLAPPHPAVTHATHLIHHQLDQPLHVPTLADAVRLSQNYLARLFKQHHGTSMLGYQQQRRIQRARALLRTTNLPIKTIGAQVGLHDPHHFNKVFRENVGVSPSGYREGKS